MPLPHPKDPDTIIMASTVSWKSTDGGTTWAPFKGAPGGEDYQNGWINPDNPDIMLLAADQGAVVTLNGGQTWSSWYNQPTAQLYHVAADNAFPYRVCSGQQESGSACVSSRGNYGAISVRDWMPVGVDEYGYVAPDPLNPDIVYGGRTVSRFDRRTGQVSTVGPVGGTRGGPRSAGNFRQVRTMPVVFSEVDKRSLFFANNHLWKTVDGGQTWTQISPDLTRKTWDDPGASASTVAPRVAVEPARRDLHDRAVVSGHQPHLGRHRRRPDPRDRGRRRHLEGRHAAASGPWAKVSLIDAGRFDPLTAYAAINTLRLDDLRPHIFRTHDGGTTWTEIVPGIPAGETVNAVREDPKRKGLLFAGTERAVYVSFDDGANWQSLRLNMRVLGARSHREGRRPRRGDARARVLDSRRHHAAAPDRCRDGRRRRRPVQAHRPPGACGGTRAPTCRGRSKSRPAQNPPDGAIINYYLKQPRPGRSRWRSWSGRPRRAPLLERRPGAADPGSGDRARADLLVSPAAGAFDGGWNAPLHLGRALPADRRSRRRAADVAACDPGDPVQHRARARHAVGITGHLQVKLTVNGKSYTQPIAVKQDPRVRTPALAMQQVYSLTNAMYFGALDAQEAAIARAAAWRDQIGTVRGSASGDAPRRSTAFERKLDAVVGAPAAGGRWTRRTRWGGGAASAGGGERRPPKRCSPSRTQLGGLMNSMQAADVAPTANTLNAVAAARAAALRVMGKWKALETIDLPAVNARLRAAGVATFK